MNASTGSDEQPPHPFGQFLEPGEFLLWLARPNRDVFQAQQAKVHLYILGFSAVVIFLLGVWPFRSQAAPVYAAVSFVFALTGVIQANRTNSGNEEWSIT